MLGAHRHRVEPGYREEWGLDVNVERDAPFAFRPEPRLEAAFAAQAADVARAGPGNDEQLRRHRVGVQQHRQEVA